MLINENLRTFLLADTTIKGLVYQRCYSDEIPPNKPQMPAIVYFFVDGISSETLSGTLDHARARVQIDCYGDSRVQSMVVAERVRLRLSGHRGDFGTGWCQAIELEGGFRHTIELTADDKRRFVTSQDFLVHYAQATA